MQNQNTKYTIAENRPIAQSIYLLRVVGDTSLISRAGQFVNIQLPNFYLRRPISVATYDSSSITLIYKVLGEGTEQMTYLKEGTQLDMLSGLGNGFDADVLCDSPLLVGGGVGVPPLYHLAKTLSQKHSQINVVLGFNQKDDIFYEKEFADIPNTKVHIATMDGSFGTKGTVVDVIKSLTKKGQELDYLFSCGPTPMLKALYSELSIDGQFSLEERMGCGFGGCMGCSHQTKDGYKRVCKEGPVFYKKELLW